MSHLTHLIADRPLARYTFPGLLLRLEGAVFLAAALLVYRSFSFSWLAFFLLLLLPDLTMIGYVWGQRAGSVLYNLGHTYILPLGLGGISLWFGFMPGVQVAIIWLAHIGLDRLVGYGLKYPTDFKETHLSRV
ncbi:MAG: DUF4260 family protein [Anaerolineae bacterium]|nr:DUF4260 family protein [Anaerolineae bacterium]